MRKLSLKAGALDLDGSTMPQGGPVGSPVAGMLRDIQKCGLPLWPSTGKGIDYARGLACGMGFVWDGMIAETGARIVPYYRQKSAGIRSDSNRN